MRSRNLLRRLGRMEPPKNALREFSERFDFSVLNREERGRLRALFEKAIASGWHGASQWDKSAYEEAKQLFSKPGVISNLGRKPN